MSHTEKRWFIQSAEGMKGPVSPLQLKSMVLAGELSKANQVRHGEKGEWMPASKVRGLFSNQLRVDQAHGSEFQTCHKCHESVFSNAYVCKYCGSFLGEDNENGEENARVLA